MPVAVQISALPMPPASWFTSPRPLSRMPRNIWIMPTTVPNRPSSGPAAAMVPSPFRKRSIRWTRWRPTSSMRSRIWSRGRLRTSSAAASSAPSGEVRRSESMWVGSRLPRAAHARTSAPSPGGSTVLRRRLQNRSRMMPSATTVSSSKGIIGHPPALTSSSTSYPPARGRVSSDRKFKSFRGIG